MNKAPEKNTEVRPDKNTGEKKNESFAHEFGSGRHRPLQPSN